MLRVQVARAVDRKLRPAPPATELWRGARGARCCWPTPSTIRPRRCFWGWAADPVRGRSPECVTVTRPGTGRCWVCGGLPPHAACAELGLIAWGRPAQSDRRFTRLRPAPRCCRCSRTCLAKASPRRWPAQPRRCGRQRGSGFAGRTASCGRALRNGAGDRRSVDASRGAARRVIRGWLVGGGATGLTDHQIRAVDALVTRWRGQGGVAVGWSVPHTRLFVERRGCSDVALRAGRIVWPTAAWHAVGVAADELAPGTSSRFCCPKTRFEPGPTSWPPTWQGITHPPWTAGTCFW